MVPDVMHDAAAAHALCRSGAGSAHLTLGALAAMQHAPAGDSVGRSDVVVDHHAVLPAGEEAAGLPRHQGQLVRPPHVRVQLAGLHGAALQQLAQTHLRGRQKPDAASVMRRQPTQGTSSAAQRSPLCVFALCVQPGAQPSAPGHPPRT